MSDKVIGDYTAAATIDGSAHYLLIQPGTSATAYKRINRNTLLGVSGQPADISTVQSLTNKTLDNTSTVTLKDTLFTLQDNLDTTKQAAFQLSGITTGTTRTYTLPNATGTLADTSTAQILTNKTLTSPAITGGTYDNGTITVDSIAGHTSATVVTVGGVQMNNGTIGTSNAVVTASINDGAVTPAKLTAGTGAGWSWSSWTPSWTNLTVGNGVANCKYIQVGKQVTCRFSFVLGTTSAVGTAIFFTLPVTAVSYPNIANDVDVIGTGWISAAAVLGKALFVIADTTTARIYTEGAASTYVNPTDITASVPGVWANGSIISGTFTYEAA